MRWYQNYDLLTAIGTVGAVLLALGQILFSRMLDWWRRPILQVTFDNDTPWRRWVSVKDHPDTWHLYFRIGVRNRGLTTARSVRAHLVEWLENGLQNPYVDPFMLHWVGTDSTPRDHGMHLLPGLTEFVDVFAVPTAQHILPLYAMEGQTTHPEFVFQAIPQYPIARGMLTWSTFNTQLLRILIVGENVDPVTVTLQLPSRVSPHQGADSIHVASCRIERGIPKPSTAPTFREQNPAIPPAGLPLE